MSALPCASTRACTWLRCAESASGSSLSAASGSQCRSGEFQDALKDWKKRSSMIRKDHCWADLGFCHNALTESFWGRPKNASVHGHKFATGVRAK